MLMQGILPEKLRFFSQLLTAVEKPMFCNQESLESKTLNETRIKSINEIRLIKRS